VCHVRFFAAFSGTGDAPPEKPSVFRRGAGRKGFRRISRARRETRETQLWRGFQRFSKRRFLLVA
jgi:hypothetical protein